MIFWLQDMYGYDRLAVLVNRDTISCQCSEHCRSRIEHCYVNHRAPAYTAALELTTGCDRPMLTSHLQSYLTKDLKRLLDTSTIQHNTLQCIAASICPTPANENRPTSSWSISFALSRVIVFPQLNCIMPGEWRERHITPILVNSAQAFCSSNIWSCVCKRQKQHTVSASVRKQRHDHMMMLCSL